MNVWPVVVREARETSRRPATFASRVVVLIVVGAVAVLSGLGGGFEPGGGGRLFTMFHITVFLATWVLVPFMAADCLSRERREGTLGLLFLTPLRAMDIVLAKLTVHGLRGLTLWLAVLPLFALPLLIGGLSWKHALAAACHNLAALSLALAAGVMASASTREWHQAVVRAALFSLCLAVAYVYAVGLGAAMTSAWLPGTRFGALGMVKHWPEVWQMEWLRVGWLVIAGDPMVLRGFGLLALQPLPGGVPVLVAGASGAAMVAGLVLWLACLVAARGTRRNWQEPPPSALRQVVERQFTTPIVGQTLLRRWLRRSLERNPVGWLEQRSWSGRLVTFGWLAVVVGVLAGMAGRVDFWLFSHRRHGVDWMQVLVAAPLLLSMAAVAAGSFRRERESGVLELLLVSPMSESELVWGRLRGVYAQFLPSATALVAGWSFLLLLPNAGEDGLLSVVWFLVWAAAVPCVGLYCSLRFANFLAAFLTTLVLAWGVPWLFGYAYSLRAMFSRSGPHVSAEEIQVVETAVVLSVAAIALWQLNRRLKTRQFDLQRMVT